MPRLSPLHWLIAVVFLAFYGFAVFALTRDYYVRHPVQPAAAAAGQRPAGHPAVGGGAPGALAAADLVPPALTETNPDLLRARADALFQANRFAEVIPVYRRILELVPADLDTQNDLGLALHYSGDTSGALEVLRKGPAADPGFQRGWLTLGFVTLQSGDRAKAREALERARNLGPDNPVGQEAARLLGTAQGE